VSGDTLRSVAIPAETSDSVDSLQPCNCRILGLMAIALNPEVNEIAPVIQLAVAPVFLLTAVGALLNVHTTRLGRAVDRSRTLEQQGAAEPESSDATLAELHLLKRRMRLTYLAIALDVVCALFVGLTIVTAFGSALVRVNLSRIIALLFVLAMIAFLMSLLVFLREIFLAVGWWAGNSKTQRRVGG
jgi:hypothetical protein